jgi:hypothetical protein
MQGSSPTTQALCPGGITATSPGPPSAPVPSSILTFSLPDIITDVCGASQLFVLTIGFTHFSQLHPGSNVLLQIVTLSKFVISILPFSKLRTSSAEFRLFFCILIVVLMVTNTDSGIKDFANNVGSLRSLCSFYFFHDIQNNCSNTNSQCYYR